MNFTMKIILKILENRSFDHVIVVGQLEGDAPARVASSILLVICYPRCEMMFLVTYTLEPHVHSHSY